MHNIDEINNKFHLSWKLLANVIEKESGLNNRTDRAIMKLTRCLKWSLAYAHLRNYCGYVIKPFSDQYAVIIKKFWIQYFEQYFSKDIPPMAKDFFEWYCDSETILEERKFLKKNKRDILEKGF